VRSRAPAIDRTVTRAVARRPEPVSAPVRYLLVGLLAGAVLGGVGGFAAGYFAFPYWSAGNQGGQVIISGGGEIKATGRFTHADPADRLHYGGGAVQVYAHRVQFEDDFAVGPGPKYHVYLVPQRGIDPDTRVEETMFVDLGPLAAFSGRQSYPVPVGVDVADYGSVVIWCEQLNSLISPAELNPG
jgi:hypothetical protein